MTKFLGTQQKVLTGCSRDDLDMDSRYEQEAVTRRKIMWWGGGYLVGKHLRLQWSDIYTWEKRFVKSGECCQGLGP